MAKNPLLGIGVLIVDEQRHKGAHYQITVARSGRSKLVATGVLSMAQASMPAMIAAMTAHSVSRLLEETPQL